MYTCSELDSEKPVQCGLCHQVECVLNRWAIDSPIWWAKKSVSQNFFHFLILFCKVKRLLREAIQRFIRIPTNNHIQVKEYQCNNQWENFSGLNSLPGRCYMNSFILQLKKMTRKISRNCNEIDHNYAYKIGFHNIKANYKGTKITSTVRLLLLLPSFHGYQEVLCTCLLWNSQNQTAQKSQK